MHHILSRNEHHRILINAIISASGLLVVQPKSRKPFMFYLMLTSVNRMPVIC
ncbi:MAG: hypothetical protein XD94_0868 [Mesotoga prima]|uniref:Uncharacterized protein n=1 Tax=Mesotoga prima TaxID=1184387 RepID=A0A117M2E9_9BACT|nr:MAG: hypothetical protein XD94_0868 [Mesotoga prima]